MTKLKSCPMCGGNHLKHYLTICNPGRESWVCCLDCHTSCGMQNKDSMAIVAWNMRALPIQKREESLINTLEDIRANLGLQLPEEIGRIIDKALKSIKE